MIKTTIKGIPDDVYKKLKAQADRNLRSINKEIIAILSKGVNSGRHKMD